MDPHDNLGQRLVASNHIRCPTLLGNLSSAEILEGRDFWRQVGDNWGFQRLLPARLELVAMQKGAEHNKPGETKHRQQV